MDQEIIYPIATVDVVVLTLKEDTLHVLLHRRAKAPFEGEWALPGGWIRTNEDASAEAAAHRVLRQKLHRPAYYMEQLATFSGPDRDPRGFSISIAHLVLLPVDELGDLDEDIERLVPLDEAVENVRAFAHHEILAAARDRLKSKGAYSTLPGLMLPDTFTLPELHNAYQIATGQSSYSSSFRRQVLNLQVIEETGEKRKAGVGSCKPAMLYRFVDRNRTLDRLLA